MADLNLFQQKWNEAISADPTLKQGYTEYCELYQSKTPLMFACSRGRIDLVDICLQYNPGLIWARDKMDDLPIHYIAGTYHNLGDSRVRLTIIQRLVSTLSESQRGEYINAVADGNWTPMLYAIRANHLEIIDQLIEWDSKVFEARKEYPSPIYVAVRCDRMEALKRLISWLFRLYPREKAISILDQLDLKIHTTAAYLAVSTGRHNMVKFLLQSGCRSIDTKNFHGVTPLLQASKNGDIEMIELLIQHGSLAINEPDEEGEVPVIAAIISHYGSTGIKAAKVLVALGADLDLIPDRYLVVRAYYVYVEELYGFIDEYPEKVFKIRQRVYFNASLTQRLLFAIG